jgi:hypothetical protein
MWKLALDKESTYKLIKEKRKCVDINMGFLYQLGKWEELLKVGKEFKLYKIGEEGIVTLLDKCDIQESTFSILLVLHDGNFYKIVYQNVPSDCLNKVDEFVTLLQRYENYPNELCQLSMETNILNKEMFRNAIEEIIKKY